MAFRLLPVLLAVAALLGGAAAPASPSPRSRPGEEPAPEELPEAYRRRLADARRVCVTRLRSLGDWCARVGFGKSAREAYERALRFDPEDDLTRAKLGFRRTPEGWVRDARQGEAAEDDAPPSKAGEKERRRRDAAEACARAWGAVARAAREGGLAGPEAEAWTTVLEFSPENEEAHRGLGHGQEGGRWMTPVRTRHKEFQERLRRLAEVAGEEEGKQEYRSVNPPPDHAAAVEVPLTAWAGRTYTVETSFPGTACVELLRDAERAERFLALLVGETGSEARSPVGTFLVADSLDAYRRALDGLARETPARLEVARRLGGWDLPGRVSLHWRETLGSAKDAVVHTAGECFLATRFPGAQRRPWVKEAFGYLASGALLGTTLTWCVSLGATTVESEPIYDIERFPVVVKAMVQRGDDPSLSLVARRDLNSHTGPSVAKAWSVIAWLLETRPKELHGFLRAIGQETPEEEAARAAFGTGLDELDHLWREWVREVL